MNPGLVVKLRPSGPWRIGPDSGARNRVDVIYHSDSLYSAVTAAMARLGWLEEWLDATARNGESVVSFGSCFPYMDEIGFVVPPRTVWPPVSNSTKAARVRWKSARFVPLTVVQSILAGRRLDENQWSVDGPSDCLVPAGRPGPFRTAVRWSAGVDRLSGVTERHSTACLEFRAGSGLWTVVSFQNEEAQARWADRVKGVFRLLADTGFGGERSRGWGRSEAPEFTDGMLPDLILPPRSEVVEAAAETADADSQPPVRAATIRERARVAPMAAAPRKPAAAVEPEPEVAEAPESKQFSEAELQAAGVENAAVPEISGQAAEAQSEPVPIAELEAPAAEAVAVPEIPAEAAAPAPESPAVELAGNTESAAPAAVAVPEIPADAAAPVGEPLAVEPAAGTESEAPAAEAVAVPEIPAEAVEPVAITEPETAAADAAEAPVLEPVPIAELEAPAAEAVAVPEIPADDAAPAPEAPAVEPVAGAEPEAPAADATEAAAPEPAPVTEPEAPASETVASEAPGPEPVAGTESAAPAPVAAEPAAEPVPVAEPEVPAAEPSAPTHPHWLLSVFTPAPADTVDWQRGNYTVLARGGRVDSPAGSGELKKQIHMVAEGSVVYAEAAPRGSAANVAPDGFAHPVFRSGFALAIPLPEVS